jgi:hypothetical protein
VAAALELAVPVLVVSQSCANQLHDREYKLAILAPITHLDVGLQVDPLVAASVAENVVGSGLNHLFHALSELQCVQAATSWELGKGSWGFAATSNRLVKITTQYLILASSLRVDRSDFEESA